jgi:hypothetical protein
VDAPSVCSSSERTPRTASRLPAALLHSRRRG